MKPAAQSLAAWLAGPLLALAGALAVRGLAPEFAGRPRAVLLVAGYLLVPIGLAWFASQLGRRAVRRATAEPTAGSAPRP